MEIGKIFIRSIVGIVAAGIVTVLVGTMIIPEIMIAFYLAIGTYVYLDRDVSGDKL